MKNLLSSSWFVGEEHTTKAAVVGKTNKGEKTKDVVKQELNNLIIYPNPANSVINILDKNVVSIQITNVLGKVEMMLNKPNLSQSINVSTLSDGLHFIKVKNVDGSFKISKLLIQH